MMVFFFFFFFFVLSPPLIRIGTDYIASYCRAFFCPPRFMLFGRISKHLICLTTSDMWSFRKPIDWHRGRP